MRWVLVVALAALCAGCEEDMQRSVAQCRLDAQRAMPNEQLWLSTPLDNDITLCMRIRGYEFEALTQDCFESSTMHADALCYRPAGAIELAVDRLEAVVRGQHLKK